MIFSGLSNPNGTISDLLLNSSGVLDFYSPSFVLDELENHRSKLLKISGYSERNLDFMQLAILKKIELIDLESVRELTFEKSIELTKKR